MTILSTYSNKGLKSEPQSMDSSQQTALWLYIPSIKDLDQILISKRKFENFALQRIISLNSEKEMELLEIIFEEQVVIHELTLSIIIITKTRCYKYSMVTVL